MSVTRSLMVVAALSVLAGCADVKKEIGLGRQSPDEFAVVTRAPLSLPPSYDLQPPKPGAVRPQEGQTRDQAKKLVFSDPQQAHQPGIPESSDVESSLLAKVQADQANPDIRNLVDRELGQVDVKDPYLGRKLLFWKDDVTKKEAQTIDPVAEAKRLKQERETLDQKTDKE